MQVAQVRRPGNQGMWAVRVGGAAQDGVERQLRQVDAGPEHGALNEVLRWPRFLWGRISWVLLLQEQRSEEHTSELQSLMRISYAVFCLKKKKNTKRATDIQVQTETRNHEWRLSRRQ